MPLSRGVPARSGRRSGHAARRPRLVVVHHDQQPSRATATCDAVAASLVTGLDAERRSLRLPATGYPAWRLGGERRRDRFVATPKPLIESWRVARHLASSTHRGDVVLLSDWHGIAGMFALQQRLLGEGERRRVMVAAADSSLLAWREVAGTIEGLPDDVQHVIDWEAVAYSCADLVLATSTRAVDLLLGHGWEATLALRPEALRPALPGGAPAVVAAPEPVGRLSGSGEILRAAGTAVEARPGLRIEMGHDDEPDPFWTGTTWEALSGPRAVLGSALRRGADLDQADVVLLGDPFLVPSDDMARRRAAGQRFIVRHRSVAARLWPDAPTWRGQRDLAQLLSGDSASTTQPPAQEGTDIVLPQRTSDGSRAVRVSIGVPVYRDARFLDRCLTSLVRQRQEPFEILIVDDGSRSPDVDAVTSRWQARQPDLIRILRQPNLGVCAARNLALEHMSGDAFVLVDQDDELRPGFIATCARALRLNPEWTAVATWTEFFGDYRGVEAKPPFDARTGRRENTIVSTCVLVDIAVRDAGIRFVEDLAWIYCEDWDFWAQIVAAGGTFGLVPEPLARHRVHPRSGGHARRPVALAVGKARATARLRPVADDGAPILR